MYLDILTIIILALGVILGFRKGFFFEVISFFVLVLDIVLAKRWTPQVYSYLKQNINLNWHESIKYFLTYLLVLVGLYIVTSIILSIFKKVFPRLLGGMLDNILGGILGGLKGCFLVFVMLIIFNLLVSFNPRLEEQSKESIVNEFFLENGSKFSDYYPRTIAKKIEDFEFRKVTEEKIEEFLGE